MERIGVILASGKGERYDSTIPKQFCKLNGRYVVEYAINEFKSSQLFDKIIVAVPSRKYIKNAAEAYILGGETRTETISKVLHYVKKYSPKYILFHDAARPLIKSADFAQFFSLLETYKGAVTAEKVTDSLFPTIDRDTYKLVQTPEAFRFSDLVKLFNKERQYTAIYQYFDYKDIGMVYLNHPNYKITYPHDLVLFENLLKFSPYRFNEPNLKGKNILLLGGSGGIGMAVAKALDKYRPRLIYTPSHTDLDLSTDFIEKAFVPPYNTMDIIINCSGIADKDTSFLLEHYDRTMDINFKANCQLIEIAKRLAKNGRAINIVLISSSSATYGRDGLTVYSASKAATHSLVESQAHTLVQQKIYLNCICPEKVWTKLLLKLNPTVDKREVLDPKEVARAILSYCDTTAYGQIVHIRKGMQI